MYLSFWQWQCKILFPQHICLTFHKRCGSWRNWLALIFGDAIFSTKQVIFVNILQPAQAREYLIFRRCVCMRLPSFVLRQQKADGDIGGVDGLFFVSVCLSPHLRPNYSYSTVSVREKQVTCQIKAQDIRPACVLTPLLIFRYTMFWNLCFFLAPLWHFHSFEVFLARWRLWLIIQHAIVEINKNFVQRFKKGLLIFP